MVEEKLLRYAAPKIYNKMVETLSNQHIHPHDVHATLMKSEHGVEVKLRFSNDFSQSTTGHFSFEQANQPDEEVSRFFEEAAKQCKSILIADYYKMIKL